MKHTLLSLCLCLLMPCTMLWAQGPVVYLPFDGDLNDASGNNLHATNAGTQSATFVADAQRGTVAKFPIAAHATLPINPLLDFGSNDFSVAFWIKVDPGAIPSSDPVVIGNKDWGSGGNRGFLVALDDANQVGSNLWTVNTADGTSRLDWDAGNNGTPTLTDGTWHFVAVTFDRDATMNVYFDGVLKQSDPAAESKNMPLVPGDIAPDNLPFTIMQDATGAYSADFEAFLDDILIYNRVLPAEEVAGLQENGYTIDPALGATVYLPFNGDLLDASGNGLNGTDAGTQTTGFIRDSERGIVANFPTAAHVTLPIDPRLNLGTNDFTVSFWVKVEDAPSSDPVIVGNKDWDSGGNAGFLVALDGADEVGSHQWTVNVGNGSGGRLDWDADDNGAPSLVDGAWHFVAVAFDRDATMNVYFDGVLKQTDPSADSKDLNLVPGSIAPANMPFTIMQDITGAYAADFAAWLDDIRIWNGKALSAAEIASVFAFVPEAPAIDLTYGADIYLPFDGDLTDATINHVDATDKGTVATTFVEDDERGTVANFALESYAQFPLDPLLDFGTEDFSVAFWVKISKIIPVPSDPVIIGNKDWDSGGNPGFLVALDNAGTAGEHQWTVNVSDGSDGRLDWEADLNETPNMKDGEWHFVALTFDRDDKMNVYFDGLLRQTDATPESYDLSLTPGSLTSGLPFTIMQDATGAYAADFAAYLDDLRIWKGKVLTAAEVATILSPNDKLYEATVFLPLNNSLNDFSGNGIHATDAGTKATEFTKDPNRGDVAMFPVAAHAQFPLVNELDFGTNDFSVAFWIKINNLIPISSDPVIFGNKDWDDGGNTGFIVGLDDADVSDSHQWTVSVSDPGDGRLDWDADDNESAGLKDGQWHLVAVAFDRDDKLNVYFDGELKQSDEAQDSYDMSLIPASLTSGLPLTLMQDGTGSYPNDFSALLDNVRIWNRVVTAQEVRTIFTEDKGNGAGEDPGIVLGPEVEETKTFFLPYPNPTKGGALQLSYRMPHPADLRFSWINSQGVRMKSWIETNASDRGTMSIEAPVEPGLYFLQIESTVVREILKVIIIR